MLVGDSRVASRRHQDEVCDESGRLRSALPAADRQHLAGLAQGTLHCSTRQGRIASTPAWNARPHEPREPQREGKTRIHLARRFGRSALGREQLDGIWTIPTPMRDKREA